MARKKESPPKPTVIAGRRSWLVQGLMLLAVAGLLAGLIMLGQWSLEQIRGRDRYLFSFADIECNPPPGLDRAAFLDEVQYLAHLPDRFGLLDEGLTQKLTEAFVRHPWVERVEAIHLQQPRQVQVQLLIRRPVLAVPGPDSLIAVDGHGVRLPKNAATDGLPVFEGDAGQPQGPAGTKWGNPRVEERARQAGKK